MRQQSHAEVSWPVTISAGLVGGTVPSSKDDLYHWLFQADRALLQAKDTGRDKLIVTTTQDFTAPAHCD